MAQIDLEHEFTALEQQLVTAAAKALIANLDQIDDWLFISNAIAIATAEMLLRFDATDPVRLELVDELAQGIRVNLGLNTTGMRLQ